MILSCYSLTDVPPILSFRPLNQNPGGAYPLERSWSKIHPQWKIFPSKIVPIGKNRSIIIAFCEIWPKNFKQNSIPKNSSLKSSVAYKDCETKV